MRAPETDEILDQPCPCEGGLKRRVCLSMGCNWVGAGGCAKIPKLPPKRCAYEMCPSPLLSKKWRIVTSDTSAGGHQRWEPLVGQTLCDSCYSTYRKHGTFIRSIRTNDGWSRTGMLPVYPTTHSAQCIPSFRGCGAA